MAESPTMVSLELASSGLCHFLGVASVGLSLFRGWPVQDSIFSGIWQEGSNTLYHLVFHLFINALLQTKKIKKTFGEIIKPISVLKKTLIS